MIEREREREREKSVLPRDDGEKRSGVERESQLVSQSLIETEQTHLGQNIAVAAVAAVDAAAVRVITLICSCHYF